MIATALEIGTRIISKVVAITIILVAVIVLILVLGIDASIGIWITTTIFIGIDPFVCFNNNKRSFTKKIFGNHKEFDEMFHFLFILTKSGFAVLGVN